MRLNAALLVPISVGILLAGCDAQDEVAPVDTPRDLADETVVPRGELGGAEVGRVQLRAAMAGTCPELAEQVATAQCEETSAADEFACTYRLRTDGNNEDFSTVITIENGDWTLIEVPELCAAADEAGLN